MSVGDFDIDLDALRRLLWGEARYAQRWLHHFGPRDAPRLPLSNHQYRVLILSGIGIYQVTAWYARSLALLEYKEDEHPDLETFGSGVMASPFVPPHLLHDAELASRFPPRVLGGLGPGLIWSPPAGWLNSPAQRASICRWPSPNCRAHRNSLRTA